MFFTNKMSGSKWYWNNVSINSQKNVEMEFKIAKFKMHDNKLRELTLQYFNHNFVKKIVWDTYNTSTLLDIFLI
jgi:hypothetical protein